MRERWWYDAPRAVFVRGLYPLVDESISEALVEDLIAKDGRPVGPPWLERLRGMAQHLAEVRRQHALAERFERRSA